MAGFADLPSAWHRGGCRSAGQNERRGGTYPGAGSLVKETCSEWATQPATGNPSPSCASLHALEQTIPGLTGDDFRGTSGCRGETAPDGSQGSWVLACPALPRMSRVTFRNHTPLWAPTVPSIKRGVHPSVALTSFTTRRLLAKLFLPPKAMDLKDL